MTTINFKITRSQLSQLLKHSKDGKNSDIGKMAVKMVTLYFKSLDSNAQVVPGKNGADIQVISKGTATNYEVKGTQDPKIAFSKLKVSSQPSYNALVGGMVLIRVTNIRSTDMKIHFLKHGVDFTLMKEPRWAVKPVKSIKEGTKKVNS